MAIRDGFSRRLEEVHECGAERDEGDVGLLQEFECLRAPGVQLFDAFFAGRS